MASRFGRRSASLTFFSFGLETFLRLLLKFQGKTLGVSVCRISDCMGVVLFLAVRISGSREVRWLGNVGFSFFLLNIDWTSISRVIDARKKYGILLQIYGFFFYYFNIVFAMVLI